MTTERFNRNAGATALAMAEAYKLCKEGVERASFPCPAAHCGGTVRFSGNPKTPHRTAGSCARPGCIRWAVQ